MMPLSLYTEFRLHPGGIIEATYTKVNETQETVVHRYDNSEFCINFYQLQVELGIWYHNFNIPDLCRVQIPPALKLSQSYFVRTNMYVKLR